MVFSSQKYPEVEMRPEEVPQIYYDSDHGDFYLVLSTVERYLKIFHSNIKKFNPSENFKWKPLIKTEDQIQDFYT